VNLDISTREGYAIATALRGPDDEGHRAKALFTGVIRGLVMVTTDLYMSPAHNLFIGASNGAFVNTVEHARTLKFDTPVKVTLHFIQHARTAFFHLDKMFPEKKLREYFNWALAQTTVDQDMWELEVVDPDAV
jgi:hypothetical protein